MATNISNLPISSSFQDLVIESGSILQNATGSVINNLTITSSFAITASHATNVPATSSVALRAVSASMADSASYAVSASVEITKEVSSSFADVAGFTRFVSGTGVIGPVASASLAETASFLNGTVVSSSFAESASVATLAQTASNAINAITASHALNVPATASFAVSSSFATQAGTSRLADSASVAARATTLSANATASYADTASIARTTVSASNAASASRINIIERTDNFNFGLLMGVAGNPEIVGVPPISKLRYNPSTNVLKDTTFSGSFQGNLAGTASFAVSASHTTDSSSFATSASYAVTASQADNIRGGINVSFNSGSFNNLTAVSASVGHLRTVTGSAVIIGDEFILLNADTPTARYAGIKVYDSGSGVTASLEWDGNTDNWILQEESGNTAVIITGPTGSRASEVSPGVNKIQKGGGHHTIIDSSITDTGTAVTIGNTTTFSNGASGSFSGSFQGEVIATASNALFAVSASHAESASVSISSSLASHAISADSASRALRATSSSFADLAGSIRGGLTASFADNATSASYALSASFATSASSATTASHAMSIPGVITNDITFNGSVNGAVGALSIASNTASMDLSAGNFFTLAMPAGGAVHLNPTNIQAGQTVNLKVTQNASAATLKFNNLVRFESGSEFTVSTGSGNCDMISFVTFDTSNLYGAGINHLIGY